MAFKDLNIAEMDRNLSTQERSEWQSIYASYRSGSVMTGNVVGVDEHFFNSVPEGNTMAVRRMVRCLIIIPYRVKIIIPESELFIEEGHFQPPMIQSLCGAKFLYILQVEISIARKRPRLQLCRKR